MSGLETRFVTISQFFYITAYNLPGVLSPQYFVRREVTWDRGTTKVDVTIWARDHGAYSAPFQLPFTRRVVIFLFLKFNGCLVAV